MKEMIVVASKLSSWCRGFVAGWQTKGHSSVFVEGKMRNSWDEDCVLLEFFFTFFWFKSRFGWGWTEDFY